MRQRSFEEAKAAIRFDLELKKAAVELKSTTSPSCEFGFYAARARSTENAASAL